MAGRLFAGRPLAGRRLSDALAEEHLHPACGAEWSVLLNLCLVCGVLVQVFPRRSAPLKDALPKVFPRMGGL